jgi:glycosyltransferase involved in cell wall biosynthesis
MKILFVITRSDTIGGAQNHVRSLANRLLCDGHQVLVAVGGRGLFYDQLLRESIPTISIESHSRSINLALDLASVQDLSRIIRLYRPDIVSAHSFKSIFIIRLLKLLGGRFVHVSTIHGWSHIRSAQSNLKSCLYIQAERLANRFSDSTIVVSRNDYLFARDQRLAGLSRMSLIYNGVEPLDHHAQEPPMPLTDISDTLRIVSVSRFEHPKDPFTLLAALNACRDLNISLTLIGDGPLFESFSHQVLVLGLSSIVKLMGFHSNPRSLLPLFDVFALSSFSEGLPLSILEALASSLPIVASSVGGVPELVTHGWNGFLFQPGDAQATSSYFRTLALMPALRELMGNRSLTLYQKSFTAQLMYDQTIALFSKCLNKPSVASS